MSKRNDVHSPSNLVTEDYEYITSYDTNRPGWAGNDFALENIRKVNETNSDRGMNQCHHCGAHLRYVAVLRYQPTSEYIAVGETCLENRFELATADFHKLRKAAELDRQQQRIKKAVAAFVEANADLAWMADKTEATIPAGSETNWFVRDVARKLRTYGELSERQVAAVRKAVVENAERAAQKAAREAAEAVEVKGDVPTGRIEITGEVVSRQYRDSNFGGVWKLLIKLENNSKVWVTEPSALICEKGDRVSMTCTVTASDDDPSFGFGSRPTKPVNHTIIQEDAA